MYQPRLKFGGVVRKFGRNEAGFRGVMKQVRDLLKIWKKLIKTLAITNVIYPLVQGKFLA
tara:strand:+ start:253 stop:432 length:180 start_codon:yes stop_codon:yes gene_type:complete